MPNPTLTTHVGAPDPSWNPMTFSEACAFLDQLMTTVLNGSYAPYVIGSTTPAVADQDKIWIKRLPGGQPQGTFVFYNGNWRRTYTGKTDEIAVFNGNPVAFFDGTGLGIVGLDWDGWALCNGQNNTPDLSDAFVVGGHMNNAAGTQQYNFGWQTTVDGVVAKRGGASSVVLTPGQVPRPAQPAVRVKLWSADGNSPSGGGLYGSGANPEVNLLDADAGVAAPAPVKNVPPYFASAYCMWLGYR